MNDKPKAYKVTRAVLQMFEGKHQEAAIEILEAHRWDLKHVALIAAILSLASEVRNLTSAVQKAGFSRPSTPHPDLGKPANHWEGK